MNSPCAKDDIIQEIKDVGQSIIDNAESIAGDYKYMTEFDIVCRFRFGDMPTINVDTTFIPEKYVKRNSFYKDRGEEDEAVSV